MGAQKVYDTEGGMRHPKHISGVARRQKRTKEKMLENAIFRSIRNSQNVGMTKTQLCDKVLELWDKAM